MNKKIMLFTITCLLCGQVALGMEKNFEIDDEEYFRKKIAFMEINHRENEEFRKKIEERDKFNIKRAEKFVIKNLGISAWVRLLEILGGVGLCGLGIWGCATRPSNKGYNPDGKAIADMAFMGAVGAGGVIIWDGFRWLKRKYTKENIYYPLLAPCIFSQKTMSMKSKNE